MIRQFPALFAVMALAAIAAACEPYESQPYPTPLSAEELRKSQVDEECAIHPERCVDWAATSDEMATDKARDYSDSGSGSSSGGGSGGCSYGCTTHVSGCDIKGNIAFDTGEKIYHVPGGEFYAATVINPDYGERWFCSEEEAVANGWRRARQ